MLVAARPRSDGRWPATRTTQLASAWLFVVIGTLPPVVVARELFGFGSLWVLRAQLVVLLGVLALTFTVDVLAPLRTLALALLAGYGTFNVSVGWLSVVGLSVPTNAAWFALATELLELLVVVVLLVALALTTLDREDLFLRVGSPSAVASREWIPGFRAARPWWQTALLWSVVPGAILVAVNLTAGRYPAAAVLLRTLPVVLVAAGLNAFIEEFVYRAVPLSGLVDAVGARHALLLLGAFFGLSHYYGSPGGVVGVALTAFYGWLLAKSIYETGGLGVAFGIHVAADILVMLAYVE